MINLPKLDDQLYKDIVDAARKKIVRLIPEWTDYNVHDPGITLIELLAWLKEMQQYHLDRVTDASKRKFLKLLGVRPENMKPAEAKIVLRNNSRELVLPEKTRFSSGNVTYETTGKAYLNTCPVKRIIVFDGEKYTDVSNAQEEHGIPFYAFGEGQAAGSMMYLGFERLSSLRGKLRLWIDLFDEYPVKRNPLQGESQLHLNKIEWEAVVHGEWTRPEGFTDMTGGLLHEGCIEFDLNTVFDKRVIEACDEELFWIRARLAEPGCEESPKIRKIYDNLVFAKQSRTLSEMHEFRFDSEKSSVRLETFLSLYGKMDIQFGQKDGSWRFIELPGKEAEVRKDYENAVCTVTVNNPGNAGAFRVICYEPSFEAARIVGSSNRLPHQRFSLNWAGNVLKEDFLLQIAEPDTSGGLVWKDWKYTGELDAAGSKSRCFTIDRSSQEIVFGDNENGLIPPSGSGNILLVSCRTSQGASGNINKGEINEMPDMEVIAGKEKERIICYNISDCEGGGDDETVDMAIARLREKLTTPQRAVTTNDYEFIARQTPGIRMAKVKAMPKGDADYSNVKIVVMPYSLKQRPKPNAQFMQAVRSHMENFRLVGSTIDIIEPQYIEISVYAEVVPAPGADDPEKEIIRAIDLYLSTGEPAGGSARNFGDALFEGDIIGLLNSLDCVGYVKRVSLSARGSGWRKSKGGDIFVPFHAMVCSGQHEINLQDS